MRHHHPTGGAGRQAINQSICNLTPPTDVDIDCPLPSRPCAARLCSYRAAFQLLCSLLGLELLVAYGRRSIDHRLTLDCTALTSIRQVGTPIHKDETIWVARCSLLSLSQPRLKPLTPRSALSQGASPLLDLLIGLATTKQWPAAPSTKLTGTPNPVAFRFPVVHWLYSGCTYQSQATDAPQ